MKMVRMLLIIVLVLVGLGSVARSQTSTDVYGADDPVVDVQAVQDAVDTYDIVYLHGTFDFGDSRVEITRSVEILGECVWVSKCLDLRNPKLTCQNYRIKR